MSDFLAKEKWGDIERGTEYIAAFMFPSDTKRPLSFFIPDETNPKKGSLKNAIGDFKPILVDGKPRAQVHQVVVSIKPRNVVVISSDEINQSEEFEYILVAPINTIKENERNRDWYSLLTDDEHPIYTYLPKGTIERYVDLSQSVSIHKSMLIRKKDKVDEQRWSILEENLLYCLSLGIIEEETEGTDN
ncbi:type II toxin-antitoxin system PemK/MazF family toxin [Bacillus paralicheniformis]|uniref:type II toxin-antitoxin system PemK/MazF family toxin n=1 Tax=Bacillus paralicheniformis TaxID=1648923 RepID=UPI003981EEAD